MPAETITASPTEQIKLRGHVFYIKRDDRIDPLLSGNKYRKLYSLITMPAGHYRRIVSYGGSQSNAMLSIAALCHRKGWAFDYTSKPLPATLKSAPDGNLHMALSFGMRLHEVAHAQYDDAIRQLAGVTEPDTLFLPQGGADPLARRGITLLAGEIRAWLQQNKLESLNVVTPSGTGTTAYYLATALPEATVITAAMAGSETYLRAQMQMLGSIPENLRILSHERKYHFAQPYSALLEMYHELISAGIEFDLIYGAPMWHTLLLQMEQISGPVLYVHSGGLIGNETMLARYRHKGLL
ncbi:pyridoxal-phosphate dependent enzyme [Mariprofundus erugo]|uniref:pyridoxal-phosphate dependent enzyme n=1 Tax=Mariprofundus erugo TaxID=2528639 RepID=UPI0010FE0603|nr:pyridoxal-phosphate dependent enzyme [Mariprofundus erugo]TLS75793.1 pyridoxal-phosphate dependent enzyme [Mariprofundus erugo]